MGGAFRLTIVLIAIAALALGCYDIANPYRAGMMGYDFRFLDAGDQIVTRIYPDSPFQRAGIRPGDKVLNSHWSPKELFNVSVRRANQPISFQLERGNRTANMQIVTAVYKYVKPIEEGPLGLLVLLISIATAVLIALRGDARRIEVRILALFFALYGLAIALNWFADVAVMPALAALGAVPTTLLTIAVYYLLLQFIAHFPQTYSPLRRAIGTAALPIAIVGLLIQSWNALPYALSTRAILFQVGGVAGPSWLWDCFQTLVTVLLIAGVIDGLLRSDEEHRAQMRWVAVAILLAASASFFSEIAFFTNNGAAPWAPWISLFQDIPLLALAYAVLRHRLVDLSIVVSRAAIFGFVSIAVVTLFLVLEWGAAQILERTVGSAAANGLPGQALRLAIALAVGLSARPIHSFVEQYLNRVFFGRRAQALAAIRRFALEADVITDNTSLLDLSFECLQDNLEARYVAIYTASDGSYRLARSSSESLPAELRQNDAAVVRLRRWNESFEMELGSHELSEALLLPMTVRGELLGFVVCGPKRERTHYINEEVDALSALTHRVGTAYEQLSREALSPSALDAEALRALIRSELHSLGVTIQSA